MQNSSLCMGQDRDGKYMTCFVITSVPMAGIVPSRYFFPAGFENLNGTWHLRGH